MSSELRDGLGLGRVFAKFKRFFVSQCALCSECEASLGNPCLCQDVAGNDSVVLVKTHQFWQTLCDYIV